MKKLSICALALTISACATNQAKEVQLSTDDQKAAYAIGYETSQFLRSGVREQGLTENMDQFFAGLRSGVEGTPETMSLPEAEIQRYAQYHRDKVAQAAEDKRNMLLTKNLQEGEEFQQHNAAKHGVVVLESGLQYEELVSSNSNQHPKADDTVVAHYHGMLIDGTTFDSSLERGEPMTFPVNRVIEGWQEALQLMSVGDKWRIVVPPELAYGEDGSGPIGPNSTLVFDIELIDIKPAS